LFDSRTRLRCVSLRYRPGSFHHHAKIVLNKPRFLLFCTVLWIRDILIRSWIRASDQWIRIRHQVLLFSSLTARTATKNYEPIFFQNFSAYYFLKINFLHHFLRKKGIRESQNISNQSFSYYFCLMKEGSGSRPLTNESGSGSRRHKNIRILWIRIKIHNTGFCDFFMTSYL
jgi:hypothetical protein